MPQNKQGFSIKVLTINTHKGFAPFNRRFILPELRDAVRATEADVVFLQEVMGTHAIHSLNHEEWPDSPHYEFLADTIWNDFAYGRNAVYPEGHHGNAVLSRFPIADYENRDISVAGSENRGMLHCQIALPEPHGTLHVICVHLGLKEVFSMKTGRPARTFPARFPILRLDRIYVRNATVSHPWALPRKPWSHLSDHAPLAVEIHL